MYAQPLGRGVSTGSVPEAHQFRRRNPRHVPSKFVRVPLGPAEYTIVAEEGGGEVDNTRGAATQCRLPASFHPPRTIP